MRGTIAESLPRVCGGVSLRQSCAPRKLSSSPRMRGCFSQPERRYWLACVFPAYAGVFLPTLPPGRHGVESSPRMRGCFIENFVCDSSKNVFPAYAGVFPSLTRPCKKCRSLPRVCGGVSNPGNLRHGDRWSSPRMRGCFSNRHKPFSGSPVFPAYAGVFLSRMDRSCRP